MDPFPNRNPTVRRRAAHRRVTEVLGIKTPQARGPRSWSTYGATCPCTRQQDRQRRRSPQPRGLRRHRRPPRIQRHQLLHHRYPGSGLRLQAQWHEKGVGLTQRHPHHHRVLEGQMSLRFYRLSNQLHPCTLQRRRQQLQVTQATLSQESSHRQLAATSVIITKLGGAGVGSKPP